MRAALAVLLLGLAVTAPAATFGKGTPSTTNNDDSCDIALLPAATLLLPYFEVQLLDGPRKTTLFSITNVTREPQIARVTLWTDLAYPVLTFNVFLTGYDVHTLDLYDVLARGVIAQTSSLTAPGSRAADNQANPRFLPGAAPACAVLPGEIPRSVLDQIQRALTLGMTSSCASPPNTRVGLTHSTAVGYATIDLVATCSPATPGDWRYYGQELLFDNVLTGESVLVDGDSLSIHPLVHIRAIPEGGAAGVAKATNLPYTFYDRLIGPLTPALPRTMDRRQPLPSTFAARWFGNFSRQTQFLSQFTIWREALTPGVSCAVATNGAVGTAMFVLDYVRFDEHENPTTVASSTGGPFFLVLPVTSTTTTTAGIFPPVSAVAGDAAGWMYLNLSNRGSDAYSVTADGVAYTTPPAPRDFVGTRFAVNRGVRQSQNWMTATLLTNGRVVDRFDPIALANGCTPAPTVTLPASATIGPGPNITP